MIIGISGKKGSGKDTVGVIIQHLVDNYIDDISLIRYNLEQGTSVTDKWQIHKFADTLKDIVCILIGCTRKQLEDEEFKNSWLPNTWNREVRNCTCSVEWNVANGICLKCATPTSFVHTTYRWLLQHLGTEIGREIHKDVWVNALFSKYKQERLYRGIIDGDTVWNGEYVINVLHAFENTFEDINGHLYKTKNWETIRLSNWIITDCRFTNEANAVTDRGGIMIRVNRPIIHHKGLYGEITPELIHKVEERHQAEISRRHPSETELDNYPFDEHNIIDNNGTIDELIIKVKQCLIYNKII